MVSKFHQECKNVFLFVCFVNARRHLCRELNGWQLASAIYTDSQYLCPTRRSARWLTEKGRGIQDTYAYRFEYQPSVYPAVGRTLYWWQWCENFSLPCANITAQV